MGKSEQLPRHHPRSTLTGLAETSSGRQVQHDNQSPLDGALVASCLEGDQRAWAVLVDRYERLVFSIARSEGLNRADAEDVTQNVFIELVRGLGSVRDVDRLASWLGTVARRLAWRHRMVAGRDDPLSPEHDDLDRPDPEDHGERTAELLRLMAALDRIGQPCAGLLSRLYLSDRDTSYQAVSGDVGMPVGAIGPTRARCLEKLRAELEGDEYYDLVTDLPLGIRNDA